MEQVKGIQNTAVGRARCKIEIVTPIPVLVCVNDYPIWAFPPGRFVRNFRTHTEEDVINVHPSDAKTPYGYAIEFKARQTGEPLDDLPPPQPAPADSFLAQVREKVRRSMGVTREAFADRPIGVADQYSVDDDALFEEEEIELTRQLEEAEAKTSEISDASKKPAEPSGEPVQKNGTNPTDPALQPAMGDPKPSKP